MYIIDFEDAVRMNLTRFSKTNLRDVHVQTVRNKEVVFMPKQRPIDFPLVKYYEEANYTMEGMRKGIERDRRERDANRRSDTLPHELGEEDDSDGQDEEKSEPRKEGMVYPASEEDKEIWDYRNPNVFGEPGSSDEETVLPDDPIPKEKRNIKEVNGLRYKVDSIGRWYQVDEFGVKVMKTRQIRRRTVGMTPEEWRKLSGARRNAAYEEALNAREARGMSRYPTDEEVLRWEDKGGGAHGASPFAEPADNNNEHSSSDEDIKTVKAEPAAAVEDA